MGAPNVTSADSRCIESFSSKYLNRRFASATSASARRKLKFFAAIGTSEG
jgi:hypothetical protein